MGGGSVGLADKDLRDCGRCDGDERAWWSGTRGCGNFDMSAGGEEEEEEEEEQKRATDREND